MEDLLPPCAGQGRCACFENISVLSGLPEHHIRWLQTRIRRKAFPKGARFYAEGSTQNQLVIINRGKAKAFRTNYNGREQIAYILSAGDTFGVMNLLFRQENRFTLEALEDTGVCLISGEDFERILRSDPDVALRVMRELCIRLDKTETLLHNMGIRQADVRICMMLLEFAKKFGVPEDGGLAVELTMSREDLASYVGVSRETVSRKLAALQGSGILRMDTPKRLVIRDMERLEQLALFENMEQTNP